MITNRDIQLLDAGAGIIVRRENIINYIEWLFSLEKLPILITQSIMKDHVTVKLSVRK